jgi:hypothetical protein
VAAPPRFGHRSGPESGTGRAEPAASRYIGGVMKRSLLLLRCRSGA